MDFIDRIKQSWETLVKPYPILAKTPQFYSTDTAKPSMPSARYTVETPPDIQD